MVSASSSYRGSRVPQDSSHVDCHVLNGSSSCSAVTEMLLEPAQFANCIIASSKHTFEPSCKTSITAQSASCTCSGLLSVQSTFDEQQPHLDVPNPACICCMHHGPSVTHHCSNASAFGSKDKQTVLCRICDDVVQDPFQQDTQWWVADRWCQANARRPAPGDTISLDLSLMQQAAACLQGQRCFAAFRDPSERLLGNTVRIVWHIQVGT